MSEMIEAVKERERESYNLGKEVALKKMAQKKIM